MGLAKNYFKDFDVEERIDAKGRRKKILIYKGNTWTIQVDQKKLLPRKIAFLAIALLMTGAGIAGNLQNAAGNRAGVAAAAGLIAFVPMFLVLYSCIYSLILKTPVLQIHDGEPSYRGPDQGSRSVHGEPALPSVAFQHRRSDPGFPYDHGSDEPPRHALRVPLPS